MPRMGSIPSHFVKYGVTYGSSSSVSTFYHFLERIFRAGPAAAEPCRVPRIAIRHRSTFPALVAAPNHQDAISFKWYFIHY
jgi:hypothetical protein